MALVFQHTATLSRVFSKHGQCCTGDFFGDGGEYMAKVNGPRFIDIYLFPNFNIKVRTIEVLPEDTLHSIAAIFSNPGPLGHSNIIIACQSEGCQQRWIRFDGHLFHYIGENSNFKFPNLSLAPNMFLNGSDVWENDRPLMVLNAFNFVDTHLLNDKLCCIVSRPEQGSLLQLSIVSLDTFNIVSTYTLNTEGPRYTLTITFTSSKDRSKLLICLEPNGLWLVLDISQMVAKDVSDTYSTQTELEKRSPTFLHYDKRTGCPVFLASSSNIEYSTLLVYRENRFLSLKIEPLLCPWGRYLCSSNFCVYEILIGACDNLRLEFRTHLTNPESVNHSVRDLAGTTYFAENGIFCETLTFLTSSVLSNEVFEPVRSIFWVGDDLVLISGLSNSMVIDIHSKTQVDLWYRRASTKFASNLFQVCGDRVYTKHKSGFLPLSDATMFAQFNTSLVVGFPTKIYIISQELQVERTVEDRCLSVFSEGYVSPSGVMFFEEPGRNVITEEEGDIVQAHIVDGELFTISKKGDLKIGPYQSRIDLMLDNVNGIYTFGDTVLISDSNGGYLYTQGEYISISLDFNEILIPSKDFKAGVSLKNGIVYSKTRAGFQLSRKKILGSPEYNYVQVNKDKMIIVLKNTWDSRGAVVIKYTKGDVITFFEYPNTGDFRLISDDHFVWLKGGERACMKLYKIEDPESLISEIIFPIIGLPPQSIQKVLGSIHVVYSCSFHAVYKVMSDMLIEHAREHKRTNGNVHVPVRLGIRSSECARSGNHWIVRKPWIQNEQDSRFPTLHVVPKSQQYLQIPRSLIDNYFKFDSKLSCVRSPEYPDVYYAIDLNSSSCNLFTVRASGTQTFMSSSNLISENVCYTDNYSRMIKYEPDFIVSTGDFATITVLPEDEAKTLRNLQSELLANSSEAVVSEIDGRFLLAATMNPASDDLFTEHGVDRKTLNKDLWDLFK